MNKLVVIKIIAVLLLIAFLYVIFFVDNRNIQFFLGMALIMIGLWGQYDLRKKSRD